MTQCRLPRHANIFSSLIHMCFEKSVSPKVFGIPKCYNVFWSVIFLFNAETVNGAIGNPSTIISDASKRCDYFEIVNSLVL